MSDTKFWVAFNRIPQLGTVRFRWLEQQYGTLQDAWHLTTMRSSEILSVYPGKHV